MASNGYLSTHATTRYPQFPVDEFYTACIISYQVASLPPSKFSKSTDPVPSVRFLLAGRVDVNGEPTVVRKWTSWVTLSYSEKSRLSQLFKDVPSIERVLTDDGDGGLLWTTPFKIMLENSRDGKYQNIIRIKPTDDTSALDICYTATITLPDNTQTFAPFRKVKAYGNLVYLEIAVNKEEDGVHVYHGADLIESPEDDDEQD